MELKGKVIVYSIVGCPHCLKAKSSLSQVGLQYTDITVERYPRVREWLKERTGKTSVPQIFFNAKHIGGNEDIQELMKDKVLWAEMLKELMENDFPEGDDAPLLPEPDPSSDIPSSGSISFTCELDEFAVLVRELKDAGILKNYRSGLFTCHKNCFTGKDFVDWIVEKKQLDRQRAVEIGQQLIHGHFCISVKEAESFQDDDDAVFKVIENESSKALNAGETPQCVTPPAAVLAEDLRKLIMTIYSSHITPDGKMVDYDGISKSEEFQQYLQLTRQLHRVELESLTREEKLAFFINIYNALVIHATTQLGLPTSLWQKWKFFNTVTYILGGNLYSLNEIENGVLRGNKRGVGMLFLPFRKLDPRLKVALPEAEPRIHFALNCGAKSCPPIKIFTPEDIDKQLSLATEAFLESDESLQINTDKGEVKLSMLFKWYKTDFGRNSEEILQWLCDHVGEPEKKTELQEVMQNRNAKILYIQYDWSHNSK